MIWLWFRSHHWLFLRKYVSTADVETKIIVRFYLSTQPFFQFSVSVDYRQITYCISESFGLPDKHTDFLCSGFEVLASVKDLLDCGINLYIQKEQFMLLDKEANHLCLLLS